MVNCEVKPALVYHCAAYTTVNAAEDEGKEAGLCHQRDWYTQNVSSRNTQGDHGLHLNSYVFDGQSLSEEWEVGDQPTDPQTEYGRTNA